MPSFRVAQRSIVSLPREIPRDAIARFWSSAPKVLCGWRPISGKASAAPEGTAALHDFSSSFQTLSNPGIFIDLKANRQFPGAGCWHQITHSSHGDGLCAVGSDVGAWHCPPGPIK